MRLAVETATQLIEISQLPELFYFFAVRHGF